MRFYESLLGMMLTFGIPLVVNAQNGNASKEISLLPGYCTGDAQWQVILGPEAIYNNHTCYGIEKLNQIYRKPEQRKSLLHNALDDFNYSVRNLSPNFPVMPEIYYYRGLTLKLMERYAEAEVDLRRSIMLNPQYVKSYNELANLYLNNLSQKDKALEIVIEGIKHNSTVKSLKKRYIELGGKEPYPEPYKQVKEEAEDKRLLEPKEDTDGALDNTKQIETPSNVDVRSPQVDKSSNTESPVHDKPASSGTSSNPWCRFCPDSGK